MDATRRRRRRQQKPTPNLIGFDPLRQLFWRRTRKPRSWLREHRRTIVAWGVGALMVVVALLLFNRILSYVDVVSSIQPD